MRGAHCESAGRRLFSPNRWLQATTFALVAVVGQPATAGEECSQPYCSEVRNYSQASVWVARNWCGGDWWEKLRRQLMFQNEPPCGWDSQTKWLDANESTDPNEDWDGVRVDPGWEYGMWSTWDGSHVYDRRSSDTGVWVQVHGWEAMLVYWQCSSSGYCY